MMWWDDGPWGVGAWLMMSLMMIVFWGGLIAVTVLLVQAVRADKIPGQPTASAPPTAEEVLAERFARGEIDEDEFKHRRDVLHSSG